MTNVPEMIKNVYVFLLGEWNLEGKKKKGNSKTDELLKTCRAGRNFLLSPSAELGSSDTSYMWSVCLSWFTVPGVFSSNTHSSSKVGGVGIFTPWN